MAAENPQISPASPCNIHFFRCGEVTDVYITEKGYAFVTMADDEAAQVAIKQLNGTVVDGQEIKVDSAHSSGDRRPGGGSGGGGGFRGGRSFGRGGGGGRGGGFGGDRGFGGGRGGGFGGGRGGGFGGGRGGGRGCYNCNQEGHIARECPEVANDNNH